MEFKKIEHKKKIGEYQPDWKTDTTWVEVKINLKAIHVVRDALLQMAYAVSEQRGLQAILFLAEPNATVQRLLEEWKKAEEILRRDILESLRMIILKNGVFTGFPNGPDHSLKESLLKIYEEESPGREKPFPRPIYKAEIVKILVYKLLKRDGPLTSDWLAQTAGCNYRTVAKTLNELGNALLRHPDRRVELMQFPKEAWGWLLADSRKSRLTRRFSDRSGQPRSVESLLKRLSNERLTDIAVAGVLGAMHYWSGIDIIGVPRLDLTVHCPEKPLNLDFIERLDPALKEETDPEKPASLILHFIRRKTSFFETREDGISWADPVECLLDLHEMRFESQALEFLDQFQNIGGGR